MNDKAVSLAGKIALASQDVGGSLKADKKNTEQNYAYISSDKILTICGRALAAQGVVVFPSINKQEITLTPRPNKNDRIDIQVDFEFAVTDGENERRVLWTGRGTDYTTPDKALYKAITSGHKYFLMKLLNVGEGNEDSEHEDPEPEAKAPPAHKPLMKPTMTLDEARKVTAKDGRAYVTFPPDELQYHLKGVTDALQRNDISAEKRAEYLKKQVAITMVLDSYVHEPMASQGE